MKWKAFTPLIVAIVLGLLAARMATSMVSAPITQIIEQQNLTPIVVAARDLDAGSTLADTDLVTAKISSDAVPSGAFTTMGQAIGKVVKGGVVHGQPILANTLAEDGAGYGVGATLPKGMRAITLDINDITGVAGFILPRSHVDVISTIAVDSKQTAKTLLEDVFVLAVGTRTNPTAPADNGGGNNANAQPAHTVTLLVKPKDAERLELAATTSRVRLVLRNGRDGSTADSAGITLADLRGDRQPQAGDPFAEVTQTADKGPATRPTSESWTVQLIKGGAVSTQTFDVPVPAATTSDVTKPQPVEATASTTDGK